MKYTNLANFKNFLESNEFNNTKLFLVLVGSSFERRKYINSIKKIFKKDLFSFYRFFEKTSISKIINTYQSPSFFGKESFCIIDDVNTYSKNEILELTKFIKENKIFIILSSDSKTQISNIYNQIEKKGVVFDLSQEKIWERQKRYSNFIYSKCLKENKSISTNVIEKMFEKIGLDFANIENELNELIVFTKDKKSIDIDDIDKICIKSNQSTIWQIAEEVVFKDISFEKMNIDQTNFSSLIAAIRYQLKFALKISSLLQIQEKNIQSYFPKIYPRTLDKKIDIIKKIDINFYKKSIIELFEIDLISKSSNINQNELFDILKSKILYLKTIYTK